MNRMSFSWLCGVALLAACAVSQENVVPSAAVSVVESVATSEKEIFARARPIPTNLPSVTAYDSAILRVVTQPVDILLPPYDVGEEDKSPTITRKPATQIEVACVKAHRLDWQQERGDAFSIGILCDEVPVAIIRNRGRGNALTVLGRYIEPEGNRLKMYYASHEGVDVIACLNPRSCH